MKTPSPLDRCDPEVIHLPELRRFELRNANGDSAFLSYTPEGDHMVFDHTYVPPSLRNRGLAAVLTQSALEEARRQGWKLVPSCSYVAAFLAGHPEFRELLHQS